MHGNVMSRWFDDTPKRNSIFVLLNKKGLFIFIKKVINTK